MSTVGTTGAAGVATGLAPTSHGDRPAEAPAGSASAAAATAATTRERCPRSAMQRSNQLRRGPATDFRRHGVVRDTLRRRQTAQVCARWSADASAHTDATAHHRDPRAGRARRRSRTCPSPTRPPARCSSTGWRWGSAAPTARSCAASTAGRRRARSGSCWATSRSGGCARRRRARASRRATSWSASCGGRTRCRARPCAAGEWDFCANGEYTERGIKQLHGYGSERWRVEPEFAIKLDPELEDVGVLLEPTSVVAKAWEQIERIGARATFAPRPRARHRRRADRAAGGAARPPSAATRCTCSTRSPTGRSRSSWRGSAGPTTRTTRRPPARSTSSSRRPGAPAVVAQALRGHRAQRDRVPDRRVLRRAAARLRRRRLQPRRRARERRRVRHRQRQPPPLRGGRDGARRGRPRLAARR